MIRLETERHAGRLSERESDESWCCCCEMPAEGIASVVVAKRAEVAITSSEWARMVQDYNRVYRWPDSSRVESLDRVEQMGGRQWVVVC